MKLTHYIIIFIIIISPLVFLAESRYSYTKETMELNSKYEASMTAAAQDAIHVLRTNVRPQLQNGYESYKINPTNPQPAYDTFIKTLALNYDLTDSLSIKNLELYVPVFAVVDYDGLLLNIYKEYTNERGEVIFERKWLPKVAFAYEDPEGNILNFTIDENLEVFDADLKEWYEGTRTDLLQDEEITIDLLHDAELFDSVRRTTIVNILQEHIAYYLNEHNVYQKRLPMTYKFVMPLIDNEDWYNTVDDISILAFFQGYPSNFSDHTYNKYAFVGSKLNYKYRIFAGEVEGVKRYWQENCNYPYTPTEIYSSKKDAARNGYSELSCLNPLVQ